MQSPESMTDHDTGDSTSDVTQSAKMTASIAGHSGRPSDLEEVSNSSHCIIRCQQGVPILNEQFLHAQHCVCSEYRYTDSAGSTRIR